MGLRLKLGLYVVGFTAALLLLSGFLTVRTESAIYRQEAETRGIALLRAFAIPCAIAVANNDISMLDNYVAQFAEAAQSLDLRYLAVLDYDGRVAAHTSPTEFGKVFDDEFTKQAAASIEPVSRTREDAGETLLEIGIPMQSGLRWGTVQAGFTLSSATRAMVRSRARVWKIGVIVLLGSAAIAFAALSFLVIRPVMRMSDMARRFGSGDLKARVHVDGRDEMGQLGVRLNEMGRQIQAQTESLEHLVFERTAELKDANDKLVAANQKLETLARTDALTGLYNRRHFMEQLQFEARRGSRSKHQFTLVLLDVDHFKHYNDTNGHTAGDELLQRLAALMQLNLRATDVVARYGGEEFVALLLDTGPDEGLATARKLQQVVATHPLPHEQTQPSGKITISVGVAHYPADSIETRALIDAADAAMYHSKQTGRNRVTRYGDMKGAVTAEADPARA